MMIQSGYVNGFAKIPVAGVTYNVYKAMDPRITLAGLDYLNQNKLSTKAYNIAKEIRDWIPGF